MLNIPERYIEAVALQHGLTRWEDPNTENIPVTKLNNVFHINVGTFNGDSKTNHTQPFTVDITLKFWKRGYRNPEESRRAAMDTAEKIAVTALKFNNYVGNDVKNVILNSITPQPMRADNDNITSVEMVFTVLIHLGI